MTEKAPPDDPGAEVAGRQAPRGSASARAAGPAARPSGRGQRRREKILAAAIRHVARNGGRGTSLAQIATEAGVTQQGLLYYFPSKDELLHAAGFRARGPQGAGGLRCPSKNAAIRALASPVACSS